MTESQYAMLLRARFQIKCGAASHICYALNQVSTSFDDTPLWMRELDREYLKSYITEQLEYYGTLEQWQINNGFGVRGKVRCRQDRLDWIDWMLGVK